MFSGKPHSVAIDERQVFQRIFVQTIHFSMFFQNMYRCDLLVAHMDRDQDWLRQQNNRARQARLLPLGTERAWGLPWLQPMRRHIRLADVIRPYDIGVPQHYHHA